MHQFKQICKMYSDELVTKCLRIGCILLLLYINLVLQKEFYEAIPHQFYFNVFNFDMTIYIKDMILYQVCNAKFSFILKSVDHMVLK